MSIKITTWPSKVTLSRGVKGKTEYSPGGEEGEDVAVPQLDEGLSLLDFMQALVNVVGDEKTAKQIVNRRVLAEPAIRDGQQKFKSTWKKGKVIALTDATRDALLTMKNYVPVLAKERGAFIAEATKDKNTMDSLRAAKAKVASGELSVEEFQAMLEAAFESDNKAA